MIKSPLCKRVHKVLNAFHNTLSQVDIICNILSEVERLLITFKKFNFGLVHDPESRFEQRHLFVSVCEYFENLSVLQIVQNFFDVRLTCTRFLVLKKCERSIELVLTF